MVKWSLKKKIISTSDWNKNKILIIELEEWTQRLLSMHRALYRFPYMIPIGNNDKQLQP